MMKKTCMISFSFLNDCVQVAKKYIKLVGKDVSLDEQRSEQQGQLFPLPTLTETVGDDG